MILILKVIFTLLHVLLKSKGDLLIELLAKNQQLHIYNNTIKRVRLRNSDRKFWVALSSMWPEWKQVLLIVKPETVIRWHRKGFKRYWKLISRKKGGRPKVDRKTINLIKKISRENSAWGKMRIRDELKFLGIEVSLNTVKKYMFRHTKPPSQTWRTFLKNHMGSTISVDMFTVPTAVFRVLYGFIVLSHEKRRILFTNVTYGPNGRWLAPQMINAFFDEDESKLKYLIRDRDANYSEKFRSRAFGLGLEEVITSYRSPWQNSFCERVIGSIWTDCLDHVIILSENHLRKVLNEYVSFYNNCRPHQGEGMEHNVPVQRAVMKTGRVYAEGHLNGLQHCYRRAA